MSLEIIKSLKAPKLSLFDDPFSKELISLWNSRGLQGRVWVLLSDNEPAGYLLLETAGEIVTIRGLFIKKSNRGQGLGNTLLLRVIRECEAEGRKTLLVNITKGSEKVYLKQGFKILGDRKDFPDQSIAYYGTLDDDLRDKLLKKLKKE